MKKLLDWLLYDKPLFQKEIKKSEKYLKEFTKCYGEDFEEVRCTLEHIKNTLLIPYLENQILFLQMKTV